MGNSKKVRLGIIGSGFMARTYAEVTARFNHGALLVATAVGRRAEGLSAEYRVAYESSLKSLLARADVEAVIVTTPEMVHLEQVRLAAAAGKHVLVEKPMAPDVKQCDQMVAACRDAGVILMVVQHQRFRGAHQRAKRLLEEGRIGQVRQVRHWSLLEAKWSVEVVGDRPWYLSPKGGGLFMGQCVHNFDMMRWLVGSEARRVYAQITGYDANHGIPDLSVMVQVEFASGAMGQLWVNMEMPGSVFPKGQFRTQVVGESGLLDLDGFTHLDLATKDVPLQRVWEQPAFDMLNPSDPVRLESYAAQNEAFIDAVLENRQPPVTGVDGRAAVELCQAAQQSARSGNAVELPL